MGSICLISTVVTFILAKTENDLKQRGQYLVFWNASYMCTVPWLLTYLARGWRLVYIYNQQVDFGNRTIQRNIAREANTSPTTRRDDGLRISKSRTGHGPSSEGSTGDAVIDDTMQTNKQLALNLDVLLPPLPISESTSPQPPIERGSYINNIAISTISLTTSAFVTPRIPPGDPNDELMRTISPLTGINIFPDSNVPFGVCLGTQFVKPSPVQINPTSYKCGEGAVFYPIYIIMLAFLTIGCPILIWKLWWIKDGFGIRNELFITMFIGLPGFVLYFVSPFRLKKLDSGSWNHVNWFILTVFLAQVNSVVLPLIQFYMRQRPKQRSDGSKGSSKPFSSILRWDSPKKIPGTLSFDMDSDTTSLWSHSQSSSRVTSPQPQNRPLEACDSRIYEHQSLAQHSIVDAGSKGEDGLPLPPNCSTTRNSRIRGMKGFWAEYGKDSDGNIIPLSRMNPRAFEYALRDGEMLGELVKFSVTVFSAENAKFLQEYDGLRKQVREYYRLAGHGSSQSKHSQNASDATASIINTTDELAPGLDSSSRPREVKRSHTLSLASSTHSKCSTQELISIVENSTKPSQDGIRVGGVAEWGEETPGKNGDPGPSTGVPACAYPMKLFGKHRKDLGGNLWTPSHHYSLRSFNPPYVSPYGPVQEEVNSDAQQLDSPSLATSPTESAPGQHHHKQKGSLGGQTSQSDVARSTADDENELKHGSGEGNNSEKSSSSWYGRGNTGSTISYYDVTPSEVDSYQDSASDGIQQLMDYLGDMDSLTDTSRVDGLDISIMDEHLSSNQDSDAMEDGSVLPNNSISSEKPSSSSLPKDADTSSSAPPSKPETRSTFIPAHNTSYSLGSSPIGIMTSDKLRESMPTILQRNPSRLSHAVNAGPFHSPTSSVSATFSPRLPSQPQSLISNPIRPIRPTLQRSYSSRNALTAEELQLFQSSSVTFVTLTDPTSQSIVDSQPRAHNSQSPQGSCSSPKSSSSWSQIRSRSLPARASTLSDIYRISKAKLASKNHSIDISTINGRTPVPRALLAAYWEICQTFIMPNAILELNLNERYVSEIKSLFLNSECYLEMYEPIVKEVQELVYSNVWPRFIQSIQREPQGFFGKLKRTWNTLFGKGSEDLGDEIYAAQSNRLTGRFHRSRVHDAASNDGRGLGGSVPQGQLNQNADTMELVSLQLTPPPPQASYIHGQYCYLGLSSDGGALCGGSQSSIEASDMEQLDLGRFGVMQDLDFSALQHIVIDPK
ncbi:hypothetical protein BGZ80_004162 [Entomortierella chlamydospora]|uniref:RGS domain-containing protein n=1 Tax=Entomortierella chlamydospora TaxID=101097 RepID=A0A9P6N1L0_9FUNG|nr:hypothetical protein BGZ80_004162 [Entomortierella chlamydospora]